MFIVFGNVFASTSRRESMFSEEVPGAATPLVCVLFVTMKMFGADVVGGKGRNVEGKNIVLVLGVQKDACLRKVYDK